MRTKGTIASVVGILAGRQQGVVSRAQLLAAGLSSQAIGRAVRSGLLRPVFRGVYAVGHTALKREGWWMAALLACGDGAALSHFTAGTFWRLLHHPSRPIHVIASEVAFEPDRVGEELATLLDVPGRGAGAARD
jgi:hypothetical protein